MIYGSLPTSEEKKQHLERIRQAQDYLATHRIKEIFSKLIYDVVVFRPNNAIQSMVDRLTTMKEQGLDAPAPPKPRLIAMVTNSKEDFEINQAIKHLAIDFNIKM